MLEARFCPACGTPMQLQRIGDRMRPVCPACGFIYYVNPIVAAGTLVEESGCVLLIQRGVEPGLGQWGLPAGYAEAGESPEEAAVRETREEAGVEVALDSLLEVLSFGSETTPSGVLILYAAHIVGGEVRAGDDAIDAGFYGPDELPREIAFRLHRKVLEQWARARRITYRPVRPEDSEKLSAMVAREPEHCPLPWRKYLTDISAADDDTPRRDSAATLLVAADGPELVGLAGLALDRLACRWRLDYVYVSPPYLRWGVGRHLVRMAETTVLERGGTQLFAEVPADNPALLLFLNANYRVCGHLSRGGEAILFVCHDLVTTPLPTKRDSRSPFTT